MQYQSRETCCIDNIGQRYELKRRQLDTETVISRRRRRKILKRGKGMKKIYTDSYKQSLIYCVQCFACQRQLLARWLLSCYIIDRQWNFYSKEINVARSATILVLCNFENSWQEIVLDCNTFTNHAELRLHNRYLSMPYPHFL